MGENVLPLCGRCVLALQIKKESWQGTRHNIFLVNVDIEDDIEGISSCQSECLSWTCEWSSAAENSEPGKMRML